VRQRDVHRIALLDDRDVVRLPDERLGERGCENAIAQVQSAPARLDVDDDVAARQCRLDRLLDQVRRLMALDDRLSGRHRHDDVGEVATGRLAQTQAAELDVGAERVDRALG
jgi:hypothetical protein